MNVCAINNNPSFTSRNALVRKAQDVCNTVNREFVGVSFSRTYDNAKAMLQRKSDIDVNKALAFREKFNNFLGNFYNKSDKMRSESTQCLSKSNDIVSAIQEYFGILKKHGIFNCGQRATLGEIVAKMNGFKDAKKMVIGSVKNNSGEIYDHAIIVTGMNVPKKISDLTSGALTDLPFAELYLKPPKKAIVIDPWMGFADYADNAILRYKIDYADKLKGGREIRFYPWQNKKLADLSDYDIGKLIDNNQNLLIGSVKKEKGML